MAGSAPLPEYLVTKLLGRELARHSLGSSPVLLEVTSLAPDMASNLLPSWQPDLVLTHAQGKLLRCYNTLNIPFLVFSDTISSLKEVVEFYKECDVAVNEIRTTEDAVAAIEKIIHS